MSARATPQPASSAPVAATSGAAMEVPFITVVPPPRAVEWMAVPGAPTSTLMVLWLLNDDTLSWRSVAPTQMTLAAA